MKLKLHISTENDAFTESPEIELARILRHAADEIESGVTYLRLNDFNGNSVGEFRLK